VKPRIFVGSSFPEEAEAVLTRGLAGFEIVRPAQRLASNLVALDDERAIDADVVFGQPSVPAIEASPRVRWVHLTSAGYTRYAEADARSLFASRKIDLTTSSSVYAEPCATHALTLVLALLRRLDGAAADRYGDRVWPAAELRSTSGVLAGRSVLVLGYGAIGRRLCALFAPFGADVSALRQRARGDEEVPVVTPGGLDAAIEQADIIVSTLPDSATTRGLMNGARIERMKRGAIFVNVGRGTTVDQDALTRALLDGRLGGVGLDVTDPEPLPRDHPLWDAPRCVVTPHTAGGRADEHVRIVCHFLANLERFVRGDQLIDRV
jgi:phosphoglycerate dehydrogenase-like enzyme